MMDKRRGALTFSVNAFLVGILFGQSGAQEQSPLEIDRPALEQIEDDSESLANQLLDLSVELRRQDLRKAAKYFPEELEATPFPTRAGAIHASSHARRGISATHRGLVC